MRSSSPQLKQFLGREMLRGAFAAVAGAGPNQQAELLHLARDILAMDSPFPAAPREVGGLLHECFACLAQPSSVVPLPIDRPLDSTTLMVQLQGCTLLAGRHQPLYANLSTSHQCVCYPCTDLHSVGLNRIAEM